MVPSPDPSCRDGTGLGTTIWGSWTIIGLTIVGSHMMCPCVKSNSRTGDQLTLIGIHQLWACLGFTDESSK